MREVLLVAALMLGLSALAALVLVDPAQTLAIGRLVMLTSTTLSLPLWMIYFGLLAAVSKRRGFARGWYWRSFETHALLRAPERRWILVAFTAAAITISAASIGIIVVVAAGVIGVLRP